MRLLFSTLLLAASFERAAATVSVVDNYRDPVVEGEEAAGVGGGFGKEERVLHGGKGGKGDKSDKGGKAKNNKAHKANKYIGPGDCLATYQAIVSNRNYAYSGAGECLDDMAVELTCESASKCSYAEHSLRPGSDYAMEACATFDPSKELVYDAGTGTCTLGADGIGLKRRQENSCRVPTAELSFKMMFDAMDSSGVHIDFSRNGGVTFYTEEEGNSTREAVPASLFQRNLQQVSTCGECQAPLYTVGYTQGLSTPWNGENDRLDLSSPFGENVYFDLYYPVRVESPGFPEGQARQASAKIATIGTVHVPPQIMEGQVHRYSYTLDGAIEGQSASPSALAVIKQRTSGTGCNPLFIYSHGDEGFPAENNRLLVELAKYGFIVAAPYHGAVPRAVADRPNQVVSVYRKLKAEFSSANSANSAICDEVAVGGHSFGSFTSLAVAYGHEVPQKLKEDFKLPEVPEFKTPDDMKIKAVAVFAPSTLYVLGNALFNSVTNSGGVTTIPGLEKPTIPTLVVAATKDTTSPAALNAIPLFLSVCKNAPKDSSTYGIFVKGAEHNNFVDRCGMFEQFGNQLTANIANFNPFFEHNVCVSRASTHSIGYGDQDTRNLCTLYFSNLNTAVNDGCYDCSALKNLFDKVNGHLLLLSLHGGVQLCYKTDRRSLQDSFPSQRERDLCGIIHVMFPPKTTLLFGMTTGNNFQPSTPFFNFDYCKHLPTSNDVSLETQVDFTRNYLMSMFDDEHQGTKDCYGRKNLEKAQSAVHTGVAQCDESGFEKLLSALGLGL